MQEDNHSILPYTWTEEYNLIYTSANADRQIMRCSWPLNIAARLLSVRVSNQFATGGQVIMWDQDLSNTTPSTVGSAGGFLAMFGYGAATLSGVSALTTEFGRDGGSTPDFKGGIASQASQLNTHISIQVLHHR